MILEESTIYSVLHDFLTIRDSGKPFYGYSILFGLLNLNEWQEDRLRTISENHEVGDSVEKATDQLVEEWISIIDSDLQPIMMNNQNGVSIYHHDKMSKVEEEAIKNFVESHLVKQVELCDLFDSINSFINYKNKEQDNVFEAENHIMGFRDLLAVAGVVDPKHIEIFEEIAYGICNTKADSFERAKKIHKAWREKALELRDQEGL